MKHVFSVSVLLAGLFLPLPFSRCFAESAPASGFTISPFYREIDIQKSQERVSFAIDVTNNSQQIAEFRVSVLDFGALDETGGVAFLGSSDSLKYALASWVQLENDTLLIKAGETQTVRGYVENRDSLSPGGHYGAIYLKSEGPGVSAETRRNVAFDPSMASLLFVRKVGGEVYDMRLDGREYPQSLFTLPSSVTLRFQNIGNVHVIPRGTVKITDPLGRVVRSGVINEQSGIVLPEAFRKLSANLMRVETPFIPGRYTVTIGYRYDGKDSTDSNISDYIYIPPIFALAMAVIVVLSMLTFRYLRAKNV
ncbi:MAG: hypothetical protein HGB37_00885 [Candidatus Moranbacteria bacterium]|jgi:hypothetical protein|nr:hypothetical protein [Candidatus Moranbacteria bacterium]